MMDNVTFASNSLDETRKLGIAIGQSLEPSTVIALNGTLGSGKTELTKSIAVGLDVSDQQVVSPTFTLCIPYQGRLNLIHLDAYRIRSDEEVDELGLDELIEEGSVLVVEWAERIDQVLPPVDLSCRIEPHTADRREFRWQAFSIRGQKLLADVGQTVNTE